jgi:FAD/FMN-containing dehydrogenase
MRGHLEQSHARSHTNCSCCAAAEVGARPSEEIMTVLDDLAAGLPADALITDSASTDAYRFDEASFCAAGAPLAMTRMDRILDIDPVDQVAVVEPGVLNAVLSRAVLEQGMYYPPDPSSWELSTIGGNLATNAGGLCCVKYGVTADFVRGLEVVTASGELLRTGRRTAKGVAGYDLTKLIVGSEGTLGVITRATLGLRPAPEGALTMAAAFASATDALSAVTRIMAAGLQPSLCELLDGVTVRAADPDATPIAGSRARPAWRRLGAVLARVAHARTAGREPRDHEDAVRGDHGERRRHLGARPIQLGLEPGQVAVDRRERDVVSPGRGRCAEGTAQRSASSPAGVRQRLRPQPVPSRRGPAARSRLDPPVLRRRPSHSVRSSTGGRPGSR